MTTFKTKLISKSKDGKNAQVVAHLEVNGKKISATRHVERQKLGAGLYVWFGLNPHPEATQQRALVERAVGRAQQWIANASAKLTKYDAEVLSTKEEIQKATADLQLANETLGKLQKRQAEINEQYPLKVAFEF